MLLPEIVREAPCRTNFYIMFIYMVYIACNFENSNFLLPQHDDECAVLRRPSLTEE